MLLQNYNSEEDPSKLEEKHCQQKIILTNQH